MSSFSSPTTAVRRAAGARCALAARSLAALSLAALVACATLPAGAQPAGGTPFRRFAIPEGLSAYEVTALHQEEGNGFLWIGTLDGLNRFDGYEFVVYRRAQGLSDNSVNYGALYEQGGALWIGTRGGLDRLDLATGRFEHFRHVPGDTASLSDDTVTSIAPAGPGALWVGTVRGLNRLDLATGRFARFTHDPARARSLCGDLVTSLYQSPAGVLWVGTGAGLCRYDAARGWFVRVPLPAPEAPAYVSQVVAGRDGQLWIGTLGQGILRLDPATERWTAAYRHDPAVPGSLPGDQVPTLMEDEAGLWAGTWRHGLCFLPAGEQAFTCEQNRLDDPSSLPGDHVSALLRDASGNLFVGTWQGLSQRAAVKRFATYGYRPGRTGTLSHPQVNAIYEDRDGVLWVGTLGGGLDRLDRATGAVTHYRHDPRDPTSLGADAVWSITEHAGDLWVATEGGGISRLNRRRGTFVRYRHDPKRPRSLGSDLVYTVYEDERGTLWAGTATGGLFRYDPQDDGFTAYRPGPGDTTSLAHGSAWPLLAGGGDLWVGTFGGGLDRLDRQTGRFSHHRHRPSDASSLGSDHVMTLPAGPDGAIWAGTLGAGLHRLDPPTGRFTRFTTADGLSHDNATCVLVDEDAVWAGTTDGLSRLDLASGAFTRYGRPDGLPSPVFLPGACARGRDGTLFFGTMEGLVAFRPEDIHDSRFTPRLVLTGFDVFDEPAQLDTSVARVRRITLPYDRNFVSLRFAALDFTAPSQHVYRYRLEGLDPGWVEAGGLRSARYTGLRPGTYTFRVQGTNSDGRWSPSEARLQLVVVPPFWQTWWFALLAAGAVAGLLLAAHRFRVHHVMEAERVRRRIASDLHDDLGNEVNSLAFSLERAARSSQHDLAQRERLSAFATRAHRVATALRDATWLVDTRNDTLVDLVDRLHEITFQIVPDGRATFEVPPELPAVRVSMERRQHVCLICKEALTNAARHAGARSVHVRLHVEGRTLSVRIADDGAGFSHEGLRRVNGLDNMHARARQIGARLDVDSTVGAGTVIHLDVRMA